MTNKGQVEFLQNFYKDKKVLVTGVHGFKGCWLALLLHELGAEVVGVGRQSHDNLLFSLLNFDEIGINTFEFDIRNRVFPDLIAADNPDVAFHLAAQPIVSVGYDDPYRTFSTNVLGVVNFLEGIRQLEKRVSVVNVTTDKCYQNVEKEEPYLETDRLMGKDPYSSSKSCAELVTYSYRESFFNDSDKIISTGRAGNVIGGGDFALNRIIPDMARSLQGGSPVVIRNFESMRPYEHVLDAVYAYALIGARQWGDSSLAGAYNVGPNNESVMKTQELVDYFTENSDLKIIDGSDKKEFNEAKLLALDSTKLRETLNWSPVWASKEEMLDKTLSWYYEWIQGGDLTAFTFQQIEEFLHG